MDAEDISRKWYYAQAGEKYGPLPPARILEMVQSGDLDGNTLVWTRGMDGWTPLEDTKLWGADPDEITLSTEQAPTPSRERQRDGALRWTSGVAWVLNVFAKEGSVLLLAAGTALIYLETLPIDRVTLGGATVLVALLNFLVCRTISGTLRVQCNMARRQQRMMDEVRWMARGPEDPVGGSR